MVAINCGKPMAGATDRRGRELRCGIVGRVAFSHRQDPALSRRIALVEDEPAIRANYADALRRQGYDVATYGDRAGRAGGIPRRACPISR